jgi:hypothetical protein
MFAIDGLLWIWLYRLWPRCLDAMVVVKAADLLSNANAKTGGSPDGAIGRRMIGSIHRECPDRSVIFNERDLHRVLFLYVDYYPTNPHPSVTRQGLPRLARDPVTQDRESHRHHASPWLCTTATNVSPPDSYQIPTHHWLLRGRYAVV